MTVTIEMCDNGRIIAYTISDPWTVNDLTAHFPEDQHYRDHARHRIHALFNVQHVKTVPPLLLTARNCPSLIHPNRGYIVVVGAMPMLQTVAEIAFQLTGFAQGKFVPTEEEGWAFLRQIIIDERKSDFPPA